VKYHILLPSSQHVGTPVDSAHWVAILTSCSGYEPYHKQRLPAADIGVSVVDFLVFDSLFPRSVRRCVRECQAAAHAISGRPLAQAANEVEEGLRELAGWLDGTTIEVITRSGLHEALTSVVNRVHALGDAIHRTYFDPGPQTPRMSFPAPPASLSEVRDTKSRGACQCQVGTPLQ
jgi:uncharacterized alpha-E superfamily protein